jgi:HNH endonuclease
MTAVSVHDYLEEKECTYKAERYSVRDNGAIFRHPQEGKRARVNDSVWTFGRENSSTPYLHISGIQIHRIVATAFHGEPVDSDYVVDHIDTNRRNNRPENLRWLTRLENVLKNPVTRRKVEFLCGSIEAFLDNPSSLRDASGNPNFEWMRAVTQEEAKNCKARMQIWASSTPTQRATVRTQGQMRKDFGRMYQPLQKWEAGLAGEPGLDFAMTPRSAQYMWSPAIHFPRCPTNIGTDPLDDYLQNTNTGAVLAYSDDPQICPELTVHRVEYLRDRAAILILCRQAGMGWSIVGIEVSGGGLPHFIHFNLGSYSSEVEANNAFAEKSSGDFWSDGYANAARNRYSRKGSEQKSGSQ